MADLKREVGVFPLLADLETREVRKPQLQFVLLLEILDDAAVVRVPTLHGQWKPVFTHQAIQSNQSDELKQQLHQYTCKSSAISRCSCVLYIVY